MGYPSRHLDGYPNILGAAVRSAVSDQGAAVARGVELDRDIYPPNRPATATAEPEAEAEAEGVHKQTASARLKGEDIIGSNMMN